jgi:hypothetical protein
VQCFVACARPWVSSLTTQKQTKKLLHVVQTEMSHKRRNTSENEKRIRSAEALHSNFSGSSFSKY